MICVIAGNYQEARTWARGQELTETDWFYPKDELDLINKKDFHVIVIGTAGHNVPSGYFDKFYQLAQRRGRMK